MINYYYWFSCFAYCDRKKIEQTQCCNNILDNWDIVLYKEYNYQEGMLDVIIDMIKKLFEKVIKKIKDKISSSSSSRSSSNGRSSSESSSSSSRSSSSSGSSSDGSSGINFYDNEIYGINDILEDTLNMLIDFKNDIFEPTEITEIVDSFLKENLENIILGEKLNFKPLLYKFVYLYNFVILKNDEYKKIVVAFPGSSTYLELLDEVYSLYKGMKKLDIDEEEKDYFVMERYYDIFNTLEKDLFDNLASLTGINDPEYQIIFIGHSLGGAISTISSFYYIKKYYFNAKNILITFGQPKVGNENFAKELTNIMNNTIYRIARPYDIASLFPMKDTEYIVQYIKTIVLSSKFVIYVKNIAEGNFIEVFTSTKDFILNFDDFLEEYSYLFEVRNYEDYVYSQI